MISLMLNDADLKKVIENLLEEILAEREARQTETEYITSEAACKMLNCHVNTLNRWRKQGIVNFKKVGGKILLNKHDLLRV